MLSRVDFVEEIGNCAKKERLSDTTIMGGECNI